MTTDDQTIDKLLRGDRSGAVELMSRDTLASALDLARRYARIEKKILGGSSVAYSPVSLDVQSREHDEALAFGEHVASSERARLKLPPGPILELHRLIESQGIKVLPRRLPADYSGGFFFDEELGPCILVQAECNDSMLQYGLAHQYAHFLVDYDPYITTLCGWPLEMSFDDPVEVRAHHTALALLMPRTDLETYRDAFGPSDTLRPDFVEQLRVYFELDAEQVLWRLLALAWTDARGLATMLEDDLRLAATLRAPAPPRDDAALLPERFVRLVAGAFGAGKLDLEAAARYLGTDVDGAARILDQFRYEAPGGPNANRPKRDRPGNGAAARPL